MGARCRLARISSCAAGVVRVWRHSTCGSTGNRPTDGAAYVIACAVLLSAALLACYVPVRSLALRANPKRFL